MSIYQLLFEVDEIYVILDITDIISLSETCRSIYDIVKHKSNKYIIAVLSTEILDIRLSKLNNIRYKFSNDEFKHCSSYFLSKKIFEPIYYTPTYCTPNITSNSVVLSESSNIELNSQPSCCIVIDSVDIKGLSLFCLQALEHHYDDYFITIFIDIISNVEDKYRDNILLYCNDVIVYALENEYSDLSKLISLLDRFDITIKHRFFYDKNRPILREMIDELSPEDKYNLLCHTIFTDLFSIDHLTEYIASSYNSCGYVVSVVCTVLMYMCANDVPIHHMPSSMHYMMNYIANEDNIYGKLMCMYIKRTNCIISEEDYHKFINEQIYDSRYPSLDRFRLY